MRVLPLEILPDYLTYTLFEKSDTELHLKIYNIVIGSYMCESDITTLNPKYKRNHECTQFTKNVFTKIETQFSPSMLEYISHFKTITITQYLLLIDSMYSSETNYYGLKAEIPEIITNDNLTMNYNIVHNEHIISSITSTITPIIIPSNITYNNTIDIIKLILHHTSRIPILINILDCTSNLLTNAFVNNDNPHIYIPKPDCLLLDNTPEYLPIITFDATTNQIRWVNYNSDKQHMPDLMLVKDICKASENTYKLLCVLYRVYVVNIAFVAIYKMLGQLSITKEYRLHSGEIIIFYNMGFNTMYKYWANPEFRDLLMSCMDPYFVPNIQYYINSLFQNETILAGVKNNTSLQDVLLQEAHNCIQIINEYFPDAAIILENRDNATIRCKIRKYIEQNGTYF
jgi:hypothetical protein